MPFPSTDPMAFLVAVERLVGSRASRSLIVADQNGWEGDEVVG